MVSNGLELLRSTARLVRDFSTNPPACVVTKYGAGNMAARLHGIPNISFNDDDVDAVPLIAWTSYPFANRILAPAEIRMGRWSKKANRYAGYHELGYLEPAYFHPDTSVREILGVESEERFAIIRLSAMRAHHDVGEAGISRDALKALIDTASGRMRVFITSESPLLPEFEHLRLTLAPELIHHALSEASLFIGDSQTMTAEAAVLGTPAVRISSFVGRLSALEDLQRYELAYGFKPDEIQAALGLVRDLCDNKMAKEAFQGKHKRMLEERHSPVPHFIQAITELVERKNP